MICIKAMEGLGDNFHHRAIIRQLLDAGETILLQTSWPSVWHDMVGEQLRLVFPELKHRTQAKNAQRENALYAEATFPPGARVIEMHWRPKRPRLFTSVLGEMYRSFDGMAGIDPATADFRMPVPDWWATDLRAELAQVERPIMFYRPLVNRSNWRNGDTRNPERAAYARLFRSIRDRFYVVSVADLNEGTDREWIVGEPIEADREFHGGELGVRELCALAKCSALVFAAPGFAIPMAQAVGTPSVCVFGNFENSKSFSVGARFTPFLGIDTVSKCEHFRPVCGCNKRINLNHALPQLHRFVETYCHDDDEHSRQDEAFATA